MKILAALKERLPLIGWVAAVGLALYVGFCSAPAPSSSTVAQGLGTAVGEDSESFEIKRIQSEWCTNLAKLWAEGFDFPIDPVQPVVNDRWTKSNQYVRVGTYFACRFAVPHYGASTQMTYGKARIIQDLTENLAGSQDFVDNTNGTEPDDHKIARSVTLAHSVESSLTTDFSFDVTLQNTTTLKGGVPLVGAEVETQFTATFGSHFGQSATETKALNTSVTRSTDDDVAVPAGHKDLFALETRNVGAEVPFHVDGVLDFSFEILIPSRGSDRYGAFVANERNLGWVNHDRTDGRHGYGFKFSGIEEFAQFLNGVHTDWPAMAGWKASASTAALATAETLTGTSRRTIVLDGIQRRDAQESITLTILDVTDCPEQEVETMTEQLDTDPTATAEKLTDAYACASLRDRRQSNAS